MRVAGISIDGTSVAGIGTSLSLPELNITLDCGIITPASMKCQHVLISHGHLDHFHCIDRHAYLRAMSGSPDKSIFYVPPCLEQAVHEKFRATSLAQNRTDQPEFEVKVMAPGETVEIRKGMFVRAFKTVHRIPSQGYVIFEKRNRLKAEYAHLAGTKEGGQEIGRLRKGGTVVTDEVEIPLVTYTGDTQAQIFDRDEMAFALSAKVLITECTFFGEDQTPAFARKRGHIHMDELAQRAGLFEGTEALVLAHFSQRYTNRDVEDAIACLPKALRDKTSFMRMPKHALTL